MEVTQGSPSLILLPSHQLNDLYSDMEVQRELQERITEFNLVSLVLRKLESWWKKYNLTNNNMFVNTAPLLMMAWYSWVPTFQNFHFLARY